MKFYPSNSEILKTWKKHPIRIPGQTISKCCDKPVILVESKSGGYVTQNCPKCGKLADTLKEDDFLKINLWKINVLVACPKCKQEMKPEVTDKNYTFTCRKCDIAILLASLLPRYEQIADNEVLSA